MSDHVFSHEHRIENFSIVNMECVPDKFGSDRGTPRPRLNWLFAANGSHLRDLFHKAKIDERTFFNRTSHNWLILFHWPAIAPHQNEPIRILSLHSSLEAFGDYTPRSYWMPAAGRFAGTASHWMVDRVLGHSATHWPDAAMTTSTSLTQYYTLMIGISHLTDSRKTIFMDSPNFTRR